MLVVTMVVVGLGVTLGTASVVQDIAVARNKSVQSGSLDVPDLQPASAKKRITAPPHNRGIRSDALFGESGHE
jgi:hypothetical protein